MIHTVKGFSTVDETEVDVFLKFTWFLYDPANVGNLISGSSHFLNPAWTSGSPLVHILLKPSMQDFKYDPTSMGDECGCIIMYITIHIYVIPVCCVLSHSVVSDSLWPHGLQPARLLSSWGFPGKNTGVGCHALLQGIFTTQGLNPGLPHYRRILYHLSH